MTREKLLQHLRDHGCQEVKEGGRHTRVLNPANGRRSFVPRHREIKTGTAHAICKQLDIPPPPTR
jgi:predicted RNA binding protein YcfA (HicA-like mRNA interferase family)